MMKRIESVGKQALKFGVKREDKGNLRRVSGECLLTSLWVGPHFLLILLCFIAIQLPTKLQAESPLEELTTLAAKDGWDSDAARRGFESIYQRLAYSTEIETARTEFFLLLDRVSEPLLSREKPLSWEFLYRDAIKAGLKLAKTDEESGKLLLYLAQSYGRESTLEGSRRLQIQLLEQASSLLEKGKTYALVQFFLGRILWRHPQKLIIEADEFRDGDRALASYHAALGTGQLDNAYKKLAESTIQDIENSEISVGDHYSFLQGSNVRINLKSRNLEKVEIQVTPIRGEMANVETPKQILTEGPAVETEEKTSDENQLNEVTFERDLVDRPYLWNETEIDFGVHERAGVYRVEFQGKGVLETTEYIVTRIAAVCGWLEKERGFIYVVDAETGVGLGNALISKMDASGELEEIGNTRPDGLYYFDLSDGRLNPSDKLEIMHDGNPARMTLSKPPFGRQKEKSGLIFPEQFRIKAGEILAWYYFSQEATEGKYSLLYPDGKEVVAEGEKVSDGILKFQVELKPDALIDGPIWFKTETGERKFLASLTHPSIPHQELKISSEQSGEGPYFLPGEMLQIELGSLLKPDSETSPYLKIILSPVENSIMTWRNNASEARPNEIEQVIRYNPQETRSFQIQIPPQQKFPLQTWKITVSNLEKGDLLGESYFVAITNRHIIEYLPGEKILNPKELFKVSIDFHGYGVASQEEISGMLIISRESWKRQYIHRKRGQIIDEVEYLELPDRSLLGSAKTDYELWREGYIREEWKRIPTTLTQGENELEIEIEEVGYYRISWDGGRTGEQVLVGNDEPEAWVIDQANPNQNIRSPMPRLIVEPDKKGGLEGLILLDKPQASVLLVEGGREGICEIIPMLNTARFFHREKLLGENTFYQLLSVSESHIDRETAKIQSATGPQIEPLPMNIVRLKDGGRELVVETDAADKAFSLYQMATSNELKDVQSYLSYQYESLHTENLKAYDESLSSSLIEYPISGRSRKDDGEISGSVGDIVAKEERSGAPEAALFDLLYPRSGSSISSKGEVIEVNGEGENKLRLPENSFEGRSFLFGIQGSHDLDNLFFGYVEDYQEETITLKIGAPDSIRKEDIFLAEGEIASELTKSVQGLVLWGTRGGLSVDAEEPESLDLGKDFSAIKSGEIKGIEFGKGEIRLEIKSGEIPNLSQKQVTIEEEPMAVTGSCEVMTSSSKSLEVMMGEGNGTLIMSPSLGRLLKEFITSWQQDWEDGESEVRGLILKMLSETLKLHGLDEASPEESFSSLITLSKSGGVQWKGVDSEQLWLSVLALWVGENFLIDKTNEDKTKLIKIRNWLREAIVAGGTTPYEQAWMLHALASKDRSDNRRGPTRLEAQIFLDLFRLHNEETLTFNLLMLGIAYNYGFNEEVKIINAAINKGLTENRRRSLTGLESSLLIYNNQLIKQNWQLGEIIKPAVQALLDSADKLTWEKGIIYLNLLGAFNLGGEMDMSEKFKWKLKEGGWEDATYDSTNVFERPISHSHGGGELEIFRENPKSYLIVCWWRSGQLGYSLLNSNVDSVVMDTTREFERLFNEPTLLAGSVSKRAKIQSGDLLRKGDLVAQRIWLTVEKATPALEIEIPILAGNEPIGGVVINYESEGAKIKTFDEIDKNEGSEKLIRKLRVSGIEPGRYQFEAMSESRWEGHYKMPPVKIFNPLNGVGVNVGKTESWSISDKN